MKEIKCVNILLEWRLHRHNWETKYSSDFLLLICEFIYRNSLLKGKTNRSLLKKIRMPFKDTNNGK